MRAAQAVVDERLRIARELHDVVAHSMSVVTVQAGMARVVLDGDQEGDREMARRSLVAIERAGHQAMEEMRRLLLVLRGDGRPADAVALDPTPGLDDLDGSASTTTSCSSRSTATSTPTPSPVGPATA
jgi:signal transduction histidine kinase